MTSLELIRSVASSRMRRLQPSDLGSSGEHGTKKTSRPCSEAQRAVISVKLHPTMTPLGNALIDCFRQTISQLKGVTAGRET